jgi:bacterioferritin-associated ferredoxin
MFVCICNAVTERDIHHTVSEGSSSMRELRERLGVGNGCGRCCGCARELLQSCLHARVPHQSGMTQ